MKYNNRIVTKTFLHCHKCNKRLIERLPNGLFRFIFGGGKSKDNEIIPPPVDMHVHGSVRMKCTKRTCRTINTFQYFPHIEHFKQSGLPEETETDINKD